VAPAKKTVQEPREGGAEMRFPSGGSHKTGETYIEGHLLSACPALDNPRLPSIVPIPSRS